MFLICYFLFPLLSGFFLLLFIYFVLLSLCLLSLTASLPFISAFLHVLCGFSQEHKVLLTGTPLQNTVEELFSLLHFLEPAQFPSETEFLRDFGDLKTEEQVWKILTWHWHTQQPYTYPSSVCLSWRHIYMTSFLTGNVQLSLSRCFVFDS